MVYNFDNSKKVFLEKADKSNKGDWDLRIIDLCNEINLSSDYFTTSSCSGRIILIIEDEKKRPGLFLFRSHDLVSFDMLKEEIEKVSDKYKGMIYFKQEPCLLVVSCRNKERQWPLFNEARNNGWKKSGILSLDKKFLVELMSTESITFPIIDNGKVLVDDEFLRIVLDKANGNLEKGWEKIGRLREFIQ